jgi:hypothetical protein
VAVVVLVKDDLAGGDMKRGLAVVLDVEPHRVRPLVGRGDAHPEVLSGAVPPKVDAGAPIGKTIFILLLMETVKLYRQSLKWGSIPKKPSHIAMKTAIC